MFKYNLLKTMKDPSVQKMVANAEFFNINYTPETTYVAFGNDMEKYRREMSNHITMADFGDMNLHGRYKTLAIEDSFTCVVSSSENLSMDVILMSEFDEHTTFYKGKTDIRDYGEGFINFEHRPSDAYLWKNGKFIGRGVENINKEDMDQLMKNHLGRIVLINSGLSESNIRHFTHHDINKEIEGRYIKTKNHSASSGYSSQ